MGNPLDGLMYQGESGAAGYDAFNRGTYVDASGRERIRPGQPPMDFSQLTVGAVQDLQHRPRHDPERIFAVGKYQIIPSTMDAAVRSLGLQREEAFTPALQDRIFSEYLLREKQPAVRDFIIGVPGASLEQAQHGLAREWASFGDPRREGRSYYGGANRAHITLAQSADALETLRSRYAEAHDRGLSRDAAWREATAIGTAPMHDTVRQPPEARDGVLSAGSSGEAVRMLQSQLDALGYVGRQGRPLEMDGRFGPNTEHAVREFQRDRGLLDDGAAGPDTMTALRAVELHAGRPAGHDLVAAMRDGPGALLDAMERLRASPAGERWQEQVALASAQMAAQRGGVCLPSPDTPARE